MDRKGLVTIFPPSCKTASEAFMQAAYGLILKSLRHLGVAAIISAIAINPVFAALPENAAPVANPQEGVLQADSFAYDQNNDIFTAAGHVEMEQDGQMVTADELSYDRRNDIVYATGHVVFIDKSGQAYFSDKVKLEQNMKKGVAQQVGLMLSDGSRFAARQGIQQPDKKIVMRDAIYSPCNLCQEDPQKAPQWQLRASKIVHDAASKDVYYHNVKLDAYGVPVGYLPYFSHPDPDVKARSGFLMPQFTTDSKKGFMLRNYYYYNVSPSEDLTMEVSPTQKAGTAYGAEWRRNFERGALMMNGSINRSTIRGGSNDDTIIKPETWRGHIFASGYTQLAPYWTTGFNIKRTFDDYYLGDFNYSTENVLINNAYAERIKGRDYANINATWFQDLRPDINQEQPDILPWAKYNMMGSPNDMMGGRWNVENEFVTLFRNGQQSVSRVSTVPTWERRDILPFGLKSTVDTKFRADGYWIRQNSPFDVMPGDPNVDKTVGRFIPSTQATVSYPLIRPSSPVTAVVEPKLSLTVAPNSANNNSISNEDSRDAQIDISNLFDDSRFPGSDRVENGSHLAYGVKFGGYHDNGNSAFMTLGQSYRLSSNNPFPAGSGLENDRSDYVGQIEATFANRFYTDYRFQLNEEDLQNRRHELQAAYMGDTFEARTNYIFAQEVAGTGLGKDRQQIGFSAAKSLTPKWAAGIDTLNDLTGEAGLLRGGAALQYKNECLRLTWRAERDLTDRLSGGSDTRFVFSLGLRNLGGYDTPLLNNDPLYQPFGVNSRL